MNGLAQDLRGDCHGCWSTAQTGGRSPIDNPPGRCSWLIGRGSGRTISDVTKATQHVLADALRLAPRERAELAAEILASLDGPADPDAESAWADEIRRRVAAMDAGTAEFEPWEAVKNRIEKEILGR